MKFLNTILLLAGLFALTAIHPQAQTAPPFISCNTGGLLYFQPTGRTISYRCVDPAIIGKEGPAGPQGSAGVPGPAGAQGPQGIPGTSGVGITGGPCTAPAAGVTIYAQLLDNSCLPLVAIPAPGGIAQNLRVQWGETAMVGKPVTHVATFYADVVPVP